MNCICAVMRSFFWYICTFSWEIIRLCVHNCWIGLVFLDFMFDIVSLQYGKYDVNKNI